jgi:hypothetical protein
VRRFGAFILAFAALVVVFGMAPRDTVSTGDVAGVMAMDTVNQASADSAPKQTVVNGWTARNLLELIAKQGQARDPRPAALLTIGVLGLCLGLGTSSSKERTARQSPSGQFAPSQPIDSFPTTGA